MHQVEDIMLNFISLRSRPISSATLTVSLMRSLKSGRWLKSSWFLARNFKLASRVSIRRSSLSLVCSWWDARFLLVQISNSISVKGSCIDFIDSSLALCFFRCLHTLVLLMHSSFSLLSAFFSQASWLRILKGISQILSLGRAVSGGDLSKGEPRCPSASMRDKTSAQRLRFFLQKVLSTTEQSFLSQAATRRRWLLGRGFEAWVMSWRWELNCASMSASSWMLIVVKQYYNGRICINCD